ncbi:MAG: 2-succinyl-5-enolpyruvyl-6-hydroxy-3-cyclohexene-1-carboxylic-acid synthase [Lepagella sp.]
MKEGEGYCKLSPAEKETPTQDTANVNCRELLDVMMAKGVETLVISPGSRNTPLLIGAAARRELRKIIITDERTAAFSALGIGMVTRRPVGLICTSGTALYNYAPAVAEAYYQHVPLIVITADRPAQWIDQDDSQTLRQFGALQNIVKRSYDIYAEIGMTTPCANPEYETEREWYVNRIANEAINVATSSQPGPVHINMQFADPLNETVKYYPKKPREVRPVATARSVRPEALREIAYHLMDRRVMVVAGFMPKDYRLPWALRDFTKLKNVTLLSETISNIDIDEDTSMVDSILTQVNKEQLQELAPDIVISVGGALVSRMLKDYIRRNDCLEHWTLGDTDISVDCFQHLTHHIDVSPAEFFEQAKGEIDKILLLGQKYKHPDYREKWQKIRSEIRSYNKKRISAAPWSELKALDKVFESIPADYNLFMSNGTSVRYGQLLTHQMPHACYCNRGVSGIDGTNATALGGALAYSGETLLITGDMSFGYAPDIMRFAGEDSRLRIIVINNAGGGIFRFIKTTRDLDIREEYFCCDQALPIEALCHAYGWNYLSAENEHELSERLPRLYEKGSSLLEIKVDPQVSAETLIRFMGIRR